MNKKTISIYGQKRCGTNLTEHLLKKAGHEVHVNRYGWKHGPVPEDIFDHCDFVVLCVKNPAAWLVSNRRHDLRIDAWVKQQPANNHKGWVAEDRWTTVDEWAKREHAYLEWAYENSRPDKIAIIDGMLYSTDPDSLLEGLFDRELVPEDFVTRGAAQVIPQSSMTMNAQPSGDPFRASYYREQKYLEELSPEDWAAIANELRSNQYLRTLGEAWNSWFNQVRRA